MPERLSDLPWELPHTFLGLEAPEDSFERADAVLLPVPYESTTSWGGGTRRGPEALLAASRYIELYDQEFGCEPGAVSIGMTVEATFEDLGSETLVLFQPAA